jgi:Lysyl oxidase
MPSKSLPALVAVLALAFAAPAVAGPPDITQGAINPNKISVLNGQLRFDSTINVQSDGGPLTLFGSRVDTTVNTMDAFQTVDGTNDLVGAFQYNYDVTHQHWHYLSLDRYDLRPHDPTTINVDVARDQKTGFCLVDNSQQNPNPTGCQQKNPGALGVSEAVQPGGWDIYTGGVDGQFIDLTGVAPGTYELVQWVNADCRLRDIGLDEHTAAIVITYKQDHTLSFPGSTPYWNAYYRNLPESQKCVPAETQRPQVSGTAQQGAILASQPGGWLERMATSFSYQWRRCDSTGWACASIPGATSPNYAPTSADLGHTLRARVTALDAQTMEQSSPQDSEATAVVQPAPPPNPTPSSNPAPPSSPGGSDNSTPSIGVPPAGPVNSLAVTLTARRLLSIRYLVARGLRTRVSCSMHCRVRVGVEANGSVPLGHASGSLSGAGSKVFHVRFSSKARQVLSHYGSGSRLRIWVHVKSSDGERQTVERGLRLR